MAQNGNSSTLKKSFTVKIHKYFLGIKPGIYNVIESNKGYRMWLNKDTWVGLPRDIVEGNPKLFRPKRKRINNQ